MSNAFQVLSRLPRHGLGAKLAKKTWQDGSYYTVTKVKVSQDGAHGKVFGVLTWNGRSEGTQERLIHSPLKRVWRAHGAEPAGAGESAATAALRKELAAQQEPTAAAAAPEA